MAHQSKPRSVYQKVGSSPLFLRAHSCQVRLAGKTQSVVSLRIQWRAPKWIANSSVLQNLLFEKNPQLAFIFPSSYSINYQYWKTSICNYIKGGGGGRDKKKIYQNIKRLTNNGCLLAIEIDFFSFSSLTVLQYPSFLKRACSAIKAL